jgi:hypothetical protein
MTATSALDNNHNLHFLSAAHSLHFSIQQSHRPPQLRETASQHRTSQCNSYVASSAVTPYFLLDLC